MKRGDLNVAVETVEDRRRKRIVVGWNDFRGQRYVTVRMFARLHSGQVVPTKSGVIFPAEQLQFVLQGLRKIEGTLKTLDR